MKTPDKEFPKLVKGFLKQVPATQELNRIRHKFMMIRELSQLIRENRIAIFHLDSGIENDDGLTHPMIQEVMKEWLDFYGIVHLQRATAAAIGAPARAAMLYAPQALLGIPSTHEEYLRRVKRETRREIRLAEKQGYEFKEFIWNDHLEELYEINTSKEVRQSEPMRGWYRDPVQPRHHTKEELRYRKYYGAFRDGKLWAYFHFWVCGDFAVGKHILGHAQHLKSGIMNGLISYTVRECIGNPQIRWLYYGGWETKGSLNSFKQHAGFQGYAILLDLDGDPELLKYSAHKVRTIWHL